MSGKGATQTGTSTSTNGPPPWAQPYYEGGMQTAQNLYGASPGPTPYPGQQVAPFSPLQEQSFGQIQQTAQTNPYSNAALGFYNNLESGAYLNPAAMANGAASQVNNRLASEFAGNPGNTQSQAVQADQANQVSNQITAGVYNNTQNAMENGLNYTLPLVMSQYIPSQMLMQAGAQIQNQAQNLMNANAGTYNQYQQLPYQQLSNYMSTIAGLPIGFQTQTPIMANPAAGAAGGAASGASIGSMFPPWGTAIGAVGGGLLGAFGSGAH